VKALPSINGLWLKNKDAGLHVFLVESQGGTKESLEPWLQQKGITAPVVVGRGGFGNYQGGGGLPYAFVIGPDGKVAFQGSSGYLGEVNKQLERIKYPGLGKLEVVSECTKAAEAFAKGDFAGAREQAVKAKEKAGDKEDVIADADHIINRVDARAASLRKAIDDAKAKRRYHEAFAKLEELSGKAYKGMDASTAAADELKELKRDKDVSKELKAWNDLQKVVDGNEKLKSDADKQKALNKFYEKNEGTAAAEEAKKLAEGMGS
jgi:hypothetical protein